MNRLTSLLLFMMLVAMGLENANAQYRDSVVFAAMTDEM